MVNRGSEGLSKILEMYPEMIVTDAKGKTMSERANKYFIMFQEKGETEDMSFAERRLCTVIIHGTSNKGPSEIGHNGNNLHMKDNFYAPIVNSPIEQSS